MDESLPPTSFDNEVKKPKTQSRKVKIQQYIQKINSDSIEQVLEDILAENKRLQSEIGQLRTQLMNAIKDYEMFIQAILTDRLNNQVGTNDSSSSDD